MAKEAYYFSHDYDAQNDPKIQALISEYRAEGYGLYWSIIEMLHKEESHYLPFKKYVFIAIAKQMLSSVEQVENLVNSCINDYDLLVKDGEKFTSKRVLANFNKRQEISLKRSKAGKASALAKQKSTSVEQNSTNANKGKEKKGKEIKEKESKGKEIKVNESIVFPFDSEKFLNAWEFWKTYKKTQHKDSYKTTATEQVALKKLTELSEGNEAVAVKIIEQSISNTWKGLFPLKNLNKDAANTKKRGYDAGNFDIEGLNDWINGN